MLITPEMARAVLTQDRDKELARIADAINSLPFSVQSMTIDLSTAKLSTSPLKVGFPFKSLFIQDATDVLSNIYFRPNTVDSMQSAFNLKKNDAWSNDYPIAQGFLHWDAQASKTITLVFFTSSEFRSGSQISVTGGGVSIVDGSTITGPTRVTLSATTATIIAPALSTRKKCTIQNKTGADLYVGGSTIGAVGGVNEGIKIPSDGIIYWQNTGALYGWSVAGGNVHYNEES